MGRYFVGIEVPMAIGEQALVPMTQRLQRVLQGKRWYRSEQFHLTLQFLGDLEEEQVKEVVRLLRSIVDGHREFSLRLGGLGWFPNARVVWCGVQGELDALGHLQCEISSLLKPFCQVEQHRTYRPHITLGRLMTIDTSFRPGTVMVDDLIEGQSWKVGAVHLYESVSNGNLGPDYPIRHSFAMRK
jgi:2'-5' RNA ligase